MQQTPAPSLMQPGPTGRITLPSRTTRRSRPPAFPDKMCEALPHTAPMERLTFSECLESRPHQAFGSQGWPPRASAAGWGEMRGGAHLTWPAPVWRWFSCFRAPKQIVDPVETSMVSRAQMSRGGLQKGGSSIGVCMQSIEPRNDTVCDTRTERALWVTSQSREAREQST